MKFFRNAIQKPNVSPWEVSGCVETFSFEKISDNMKTSRISPYSLNKSLFHTISDKLNQVSEQGESYVYHAKWLF